MKDSGALSAGVNTETQLPGLLGGELSGSGRSEGTSGQAGGPDRPVGQCRPVRAPSSVPHPEAEPWCGRPEASGPALEALLDAQSLPHPTLAKPCAGCLLHSSHVPTCGPPGWPSPSPHHLDTHVVPLWPPGLILLSPRDRRSRTRV